MRYDHFSMLPEKAFQPRNGRRGMTLEGGGGGGTTTGTTYTSNIPEWLRPQTEALLGAATQEYFNVNTVGGTPARYETREDSEGNKYQVYIPAVPGKKEITGIKPFRPFSQNPEEYVAGFSPTQQQVFQEGAGLTTDDLAYGQASNITRGAAGRSLGYGQQALGFGQEAAGYGGMYEQMATNPMSVQAYMSPYMQQVVERQKAAAIEDAQRANLGANLAAARQGTYGGARQSLAQSQREAALEKQLGDIQAGGLQSAFDQAQKAQQFGVSTGLQGLQTGIQGAQTGLQGLGLTGQMASQLGNIATSQQAANLQRLGFQQALGSEQRAREQAIIDQQIQDYAMAQQYPYQQLSAYSGLLRGYATPTTSVTQYKATPSVGSQLLGGATQLGGVAQVLGIGGKAGGQVKSYAQGGIAETEALADKLSIPQLQQSIKNNTVPEYVGIPMLEEKVDLAERMKMAQGIAPNMGQKPPIADQVMARADAIQGQGIDSVQRAAGGGMVAFNDGGVARFQNQGLVGSFDYFGGDNQAPSGLTMPRKELVELMTLPELQEYNRTGKIPARLTPQVQGRKIGSVPMFGGDAYSEVNAPIVEAPKMTTGDVARMAVDKPLRSAPGKGGITDVDGEPGGGGDYIDTEKDGSPSYRSNMRSSGSSYTGPARPPATGTEGAPVKELTTAELLAQESEERKKFLGEDPRIKALQEAIDKQGKESFLDRALRGLQTIEAGRKMREEGDASGLAKVIETEAARKEAAAKRDEKRAELEGVEYQRKADIYKDVKALQREKSKSKEEQEFKKELVRLAQSVKPEEFSERIFKIATDPRAPKEQRDLAKQILSKSTKTNELSRDKAFEVYNDPVLGAAVRKQYKSFEDFYNASRVGGAGWGELRVK